MRLDKYISHSSGLTRRESRSAIKSNRVSFNQQAVDDPAQHVSEQDRIRLDGESLALPQARYFMLYKPPGTVCAKTDSLHPTVFDLMIDVDCSNISVAGRLDLDTTGLVLISDDGQWVHRIISPKSECPKHYHVELAESITDSDIEAFMLGIRLQGEEKTTRPAQLIATGENKAIVILNEGRYHQVKRMFAALGNRVIRLHRQQIGSIVLDDNLMPGQYRALTRPEIESVT